MSNFVGNCFEFLVLVSSHSDSSFPAAGIAGIVVAVLIVILLLAVVVTILLVWNFRTRSRFGFSVT